MKQIYKIAFCDGYITFYYHLCCFYIIVIFFSVAKTANYGASNTKVMGSVPRESKNW